MRTQTLVAAFLFSCLFLACTAGGTSTPTGSGGSGGPPSQGTGGSSGSGSGGSGGAGGSGGSGETGGSGGGNQPISGGVSAFSYSGGGQAGYDVGAGFGPDSGCTDMTFGPCDIGTCAAATSNPNAGTITVMGGTQAVTLTPGSDGSYTDATGTTALWNGGETLTISASGGMVPAFMGSVQAPAPVTVNQLGGAAWPAATATVNVSRATDLVVTWTATTGSVLIGIANNTSGMTCVFDGSAGTGTIPAAALGQLAAGMAELDVSTGGHQMVMAGSVPVDLDLATGAVTSGGGGGFAELMLQ